MPVTRGDEQRSLRLPVPDFGTHPGNQKELDGGRVTVTHRAQKLFLPEDVAAQHQFAPRRVRPDEAVAIPVDIAAARREERGEDEAKTQNLFQQSLLHENKLSLQRSHKLCHNPRSASSTA
jgi:hypothetical protein